MNSNTIEKILLSVILIAFLLLICFMADTMNVQAQTISDLSDRLSYVEGAMRIYS